MKRLSEKKKLTNLQKCVLRSLDTPLGGTCHEIAGDEFLRPVVGRCLGELRSLGFVEHIVAKRDGQTINLITPAGRAALKGDAK